MIDTAINTIKELIELGGVVVAILMIMSVIVLAVFLWKLAIFEIEGVSRGSHRGFVRRTLDAADFESEDKELAKERIYARLENEFGKVSSGLRILDVTSQIAPLLGLFGTILGMIAAFQTLQLAGSSSDPSVLAGGIWVALLTTAAGLVVAIPASLALSWFDSRLEQHRRIAHEAVTSMFAPQVF